VRTAGKSDTISFVRPLLWHAVFAPSDMANRKRKNPTADYVPSGWERGRDGRLWRKMTPKYDCARAFPVARRPGIEAVYLGAERWLVTAVDIAGRERIACQIMGREAARCLARCWERSYDVEFLGFFW
jgi:hypothetical protein